MVDSIDKKKKVGSVGKANQLDDVKKSEAVQNVQSTSRVGALDGDFDPRRPTREMTSAERDEMLALVRKEAEAMFANSNLSKDQTDAIELAVRNTVDASIIVTDDEEPSEEEEEQTDK